MGPGQAERRAIPSLRILCCRVDRFSPRYAAAPFGPATTQLHSVRLRESAAVQIAPERPEVCRCLAISETVFSTLRPALEIFRSATSTLEESAEKITARSMTFWSSRMLPGQ